MSVAVLILCRDYGEFLKETYLSVCAQTAPPSHVYIHVDGPSERNNLRWYGPLSEWLHGRGDSVTWHLLTERHGKEWSWNWLFSTTTEDWLVLLGEGNLLNPRYVERMLQASQACPKSKVFYSDWVEFGKGETHPFHRPPEYAGGILPFEARVPFVHRSVWETFRLGTNVDMAHVGLGLVRVRKVTRLELLYE